MPERALEAEIIALSGMRTGELNALKIDHIMRDHILVCSAISRGVWVPTPKNKKPRRVYLPPETLAKIRKRWQELMAAQHPAVKEGLLFADEAGKPRKHWSLRHVLKTISEAAGLEITATPQILRRTVNTLLLLSGMDKIVVQRQIGHSNVAMTQLYAGTLDSAQAEGVAKVIGFDRGVSGSD